MICSCAVCQLQIDLSFYGVRFLITNIVDIVTATKHARHEFHSTVLIILSVFSSHHCWTNIIISSLGKYCAREQRTAYCSSRYAEITVNLQCTFFCLHVSGVCVTVCVCVRTERQRPLQAFSKCFCLCNKSVTVCLLILIRWIFGRLVSRRLNDFFHCLMKNMGLKSG